MYATKRTVTKGAISRGEIGEKKNKEPKHGNGKVTEGREYRVQLIKDQHGFVKKRIIHDSPHKLMKIQKYKKMLEAYRAAELEAQKQQFEGENDVTGIDTKPVSEDDSKEVPAEEPAEEIATE